MHWLWFALVVIYLHGAVTWVPFVIYFRGRVRKFWNWRVLISIGPFGTILKWLDKNRPDWRVM